MVLDGERPVVVGRAWVAVRVLALADIKERLLLDGIDPIGDTPEQFAGYIRAELQKWEKVARAAGIKLSE